MEIRPEDPSQEGSIDALHRTAFGGPYEGDLVRRLRSDGLVALSLVAVDGELLVGHALWSELEVEVDGSPVRAAALAPMAVLPGRQRAGIGSMLVREGSDILRDRGFEAVIVLGHTWFYPRLGFSAALASKLEAPFRGEHFMAMELAAGALSGTSGRVTYPAAFGLEA